MRNVAHHQRRRAAGPQRLPERARDGPAQAQQVRPPRRGLERLDHHAEREQLVAQVGRGEARAQPRRAGRGADGKAARAPHERERALATARDLALAALEAEDREAPATVAAQREVRAPESVLQRVDARERERHPRLLLV